MPSATQEAATTSPTSEFRRLHITPLTEKLLPRVLGAYLPVAKDISFHNLPSFPTRDYGFVTLPVAEAAMVKKKLQGTILRGEKVTIEDAREDSRKKRFQREQEEEDDGATAAGTADVKHTSRDLRKRKREPDVIANAVVLPEGRKVKRGWTEPKAESEARKIKEKRKSKESKGDKTGKSDKKSKKSKPKNSLYTDQEECLFQTSLPKGTVKKADKERRSSRKSNGKDTVTIHEFEKTTKHPSYLRQATTSKNKTHEYEEGKGWVDENGNVLETVKATKKPVIARRSTRASAVSEPSSDPMQEDNSEEETSSSGSSEEEEDEESDSDLSSSGSEESDDGESVGSTAPIEATTGTNDIQVSVTNASPVIPHPLETLFKRPKTPTGTTPAKAGLAIDTSFSFFNDDGEEEVQSVVEKSLETPGLPALKRRGLPNLSIPVTPYNPRDLQWRSQRSAAPTPDTAAPSKSSFGDPFGMLAGARKGKGKEQAIAEIGEVEEDDEDVMQGIEGDGEGEREGEEEAPGESEIKKDGKETEFSKWFWENRGANTKAWKKRKRDAAKEQRTRESRKRKA